MKKVLFTIAMIAFAMTANAQLILGGQIGLNHNGNHDDNYSLGSNANTNITILPKIGYQLNDNMQIGIKLGVDYTYGRVYAAGEDNYASNWQNTLYLAPYFRYNLMEWRSFTLFCEAQLAFGLHMESHNYNTLTDNTTDNADDFTTIGLSIVPGLNYALSDKCSLDLYVNLARLACNWTLTDAFDTHSYDLGVNMDAQTLNAHLGNFAIGFNYHF